MDVHYYNTNLPAALIQIRLLYYFLLYSYYTDTHPRCDYCCDVSICLAKSNNGYGYSHAIGTDLQVDSEDKSHKINGNNIKLRYCK